MIGKSGWDDLDIPNYEEALNSKKDKEDKKEDKEKSSGKSSDTQSGSPIPDWIIEERVRFSNWKYVPEKEIIINIKFQKQVLLSKLNSSYIILHFLKSLTFRPELEIDNFIIELEKVCFLKYKKTLNEMLKEHLDHAILWNVDFEEKLKNKDLVHHNKHDNKIKT